MRGERPGTYDGLARPTREANPQAHACLLACRLLSRCLAVASASACASGVGCDPFSFRFCSRLSPSLDALRGGTWAAVAEWVDHRRRCLRRVALLLLQELTLPPATARAGQGTVTSTPNHVSPSHSDGTVGPHRLGSSASVLGVHV